MRYFDYISDAKVDMLFPQVPGATQHRVAAKFGFDIKLFRGEIATERSTFDSRIARLRAVAEHLHSHEEVGVAGERTSWIKGTLDAKFLDIGGGAILYVAEVRESHALIALGGSAKHLIGGDAPEKASIPISHLHVLTKTLTRLAERQPEYLLRLSEEDLSRYLASGISQEFDAWINVIFWAWNHASMPSQRIEFLAKRLATKETRAGLYVTLATPLFVSLVD